MKGFKVYNKQYIPDARVRYEDWDSMTEHQQQRILNSMHEQLKRTNPKEAHRLRMAQYRANKQSTSTDRIDDLERTLEAYEQRIQRLETIINKYFIPMEQDIVHLKRILALPDIGL